METECNGVDMLTGNRTIFTLYYADDQVVLTGDSEGIEHMIKKLNEEYIYEQMGTENKLKKNEYLNIGNKGQNLYGIKGSTDIIHLGNEISEINEIIQTL